MREATLPRHGAPAAGKTGLHAALDRALVGRVCVLGVGNRTRGDDGAGPVAAAALAPRVDALVVDAGAVPENYVETIARSRPGTVLLIDAVDLAAPAGTCRVLDAGAIAPGGLSSHALSLDMLAAYLRSRCGARVVLLGIQPARLGDDAGLSVPVAEAVDAAVRTLAELLGHRGGSEHP